MLTERGTFFGYGRLVNDFLGVAEMMEADHKAVGPAGAGGSGGVGGPVPVCFDCTHSTQQPGRGEGGKVTGGRADLAPMLARAATAAGVHALFMECHPEPRTALSDAATMIPLEAMPGVLRDVAAIRRALAPV
jgi:2-dehydro-3-deoxyphosphooctonate aldolase (KDO 8-P synthase)